MTPLFQNIEAMICGVHPAVMNEAHIESYLGYMAVSLRDTDRETTVLCIGGIECQQLAAQDADWLKCENCRTWWHRTCAGLSSSQGQVFYCTSCQQKIAKARGMEVTPDGKHLLNSTDDGDLPDAGDAEYETDDIIGGEVEEMETDGID